MIFLLVPVWLLAGIVCGRKAFKHGLGVKRWTLLGCLLGPSIYPLFMTHKRFAIRRSSGKGLGRFLS